MATQFLFQPHIHAEGAVITPDLPLGRVLVALGGAAPVAVPARRLASDQQVQVTRGAVCLHPALALVAASAGTLAVPAGVLADPALGAGAVGAADLVIARQAFRLRHLAPLAELAVTLAGPGGAASAWRGDGAAAALFAAHADAAGLLPYGTALLLAARGGIAAAGGGRFTLRLADPAGGAGLAHGIDLLPLA